MRVLKLLFTFFILSSITFFSFGIDIPKNNNTGKTFTYIKVDGRSTNSMNFGYVRISTHFVVPKSDTIDKNKSIKIGDFTFKSRTTKDFNPGNSDEWLLLFEHGGSANTKPQLYIRHSLASKVIIKENCFTILPFKVWWTLGKILDGTDQYIKFDAELEPLSEDDIAAIIKDIKNNKNIYTYESIFLGDEDITDKIKNM